MQNSQLFVIKTYSDSPHKSLHAALKSTDAGKAGSVYTLYNSILYTVYNIE